MLKVLCPVRVLVVVMFVIMMLEMIIFTWNPQLTGGVTQLTKISCALIVVYTVFHVHVYLFTLGKPQHNLIKDLKNTFKNLGHLRFRSILDHAALGMKRGLLYSILREYSL